MELTPEEREVANTLFYKDLAMKIFRLLERYVIAYEKKVEANIYSITQKTTTNNTKWPMFFFKTKKCISCGNEFTPRCGSQKNCDNCRIATLLGQNSKHRDITIQRIKEIKEIAAKYAPQTK